MTLPASIDIGVPPGTEAFGLGARRIREFKAAMIDIFGLPSATDVTTAYGAGAAGGLTRLAFQDSAANPSTAGVLQRNATRLRWHDGAGVVLPNANEDFDGPSTGVPNDAGGADTSLFQEIIFGMTPELRAVEVVCAINFGAAAETKTAKLKIDASFGTTSVTLNPVTAGPVSRILRAHVFVWRLKVAAGSHLRVVGIASLEPGSTENMIDTTALDASSDSFGLTITGAATTANQVQGSYLNIRYVN